MKASNYGVRIGICPVVQLTTEPLRFLTTRHSVVQPCTIVCTFEIMLWHDWSIAVQFDELSQVIKIRVLLL